MSTRRRAGKKQLSGPSAPEPTVADSYDRQIELMRGMKPLTRAVMSSVINALPRGATPTIDGLATRHGVSDYAIGCEVNVLERLGMLHRYSDGVVELGHRWIIVGDVS